MRSQFTLRRGRSSPTAALALTAMLLALAALILSTANGPAISAPTKSERDEVQLLTTVTGSVEVAADSVGVEVPLENATFTQEAGTTIELVTHVTGDFDPTGGNDCGAWVSWYLPETGFFPDTEMVALGVWMGRSVFGITPVDTARSLTLQVSTSGQGPDGQACQNGSGGVPSYRVGIEVAVLALR